MFFTSEDDEQDFLSPGGSKLASVFGMDKATSQGGNESLTYTAPKQPKKKDNSGGGEGGAGTTGVASATVVHAYKLVDSQYTSQGKVGAAILVNHAAHEYRILLYVSKQQQLTNAKITPAFAFNVQVNNYANFYDDARVNWSIMFTSAQDAEKFGKEVGLSKALSTGGQPTSLVQQDLQLGEGGGLEAGDSVEAKYTGWLLSNNTFGQVFDSNASSDKLFRFKVGKGKVIKGWDQGMLGMRKGGKRLLVIPPSLAYGSQGVADRVPANTTLIFEVEVVRVKLQKGDATPEPPVPVAAPVPLPGDVPGVDHNDDTVKERSKSITEQLSSSPKSNKARLISRMAKMGQPMLPNMSGAVPAHPDSEDEPPSPQPSAVKPQLPSKPHLPHPAHPHMAQPAHPQMAQPQGQMMGQPAAQPYAQQFAQPLDPTVTSMGMQNVQPAQPAFLQNLPGAQQLSVYQPQPTLLQQQQQAMLAMQQQHQQQQQMAGIPMATSQTPGFLPQPTPLSATQSLATHSLATSSAGLVPASSSADAMAPLLLSETRQQNTEMRMAVSKMSDKVDRIMEKVENLSSSGSQQQSLPAPTMETSILLHNISRIVQENERLKKEVFERGEKIEAQNDKIAELLQKNQRYVEKSNSLLEERNEGYKLTANQSQSRILALEQEKVQMATELSSASAQLAALQLELGELRKKEGDLRQQLQSSSSTSTAHREELERLRLQTTEDEKKLTDLTALLREEKTARRQSEEQLKSIQEELADLKVTCSTQERNLNERKRKAMEERKKMEEEAEEAKAGYEQEIQSLRDRLRRQRTHTDVETSDRVAKMEEELAAEWQAKCDKLLATAVDKHTRQMNSVKDELEEAQDQVAKLEAKVQELRSNSGSTDARIQDLQQQLEDNAGFKDKYDNLRGQAAAMKRRYEDRISELEQEVETMATRQKELQQQLQQSRQQQQTAAATTTVSGGASAADVATEVKKVMNSVYQSLRDEFEAEENYTGAEVMAVVLAAIKETTLKLVQARSQGDTAQQEEEESEEEEEEEEEEDEEEEEEEEEKEEEEEAEATRMVTETSGSASGETSSVASPRSLQGESTQPGPGVSDNSAQPTVPADKSRDDDKDNSTDDTNSRVLQETKGDHPAAEETKGDYPAAKETKGDNTAAEEINGDQQVAEDEKEKEVVEELSTSPSKGEESAAQSPEKSPVSEPTTDESFHTPPSPSQPAGAKLQADQPAETQPLAAEEETPSESSKTGITAATNGRGLTASDGGHVSAESGSALPTLVSREPPPLFDAEDEDDSPLFGSDNTVADTLGDVQPAAKEQNKTGAGKLPSKNDLLGEDDLKPKPPPPLFGDDDDDDDLDWLS